MKKCWRQATLFGLAALWACTERVPTDSLDSVQRDLEALVATCSSSLGAVEVRRVGGEYWEPLPVAAVLRAGDWIRTGPTSTARVDFANGGSLDIDESAIVVIGLASPDAPTPQTMVTVASGTVRGRMQASAERPDAALVVVNGDGSQVRLSPSTSGEAIEFRLTHAGQGTELAMSQGAAVLAAGDQKVALIPGERIDFSTGGFADRGDLIGFPKSLRPAVDARLRCGQGRRVELAWAAVREASAYRVQVARDLSFTELVRVADVRATSFAFVAGSDGEYAWRVACRDRTGHLGEYGFVRRLLCLGPEPVPAAVKPGPGATKSPERARSEATTRWTLEKPDGTPGEAAKTTWGEKRDQQR